MEKIQEIKQYVNMHRVEMLELWEDLVNTASQARNPDAARKMCNKLKNIFEQNRIKCNIIDVGGGNAPALVGIWGEERIGKPVIFSGHYDTVSLPGDHPFRIDEIGNARGLACLDMKGGIVIALYVVKALQSIGWDEHPVKFVFLGDEEKGHLGADTPEIIMKQAANALCAFNMETGLVSNAICVGRKGGGVGTFTVNGVGAHSGNDYLKGRNAIGEIAYKILDLHSLTDLDKGTTVSVTIIEGGTVPNGIPPKCRIDVDVRYEIVSERNRVVDAFRKIAEKNYIDGCMTTFEYHEYMAPFETTIQGEKFADFVCNISEKCGLGTMKKTRLGGGSDASYLTMAGVPTICSMGVRGEFNHTDKEYAIVESLYERTELLTNVMLHIYEFEAFIGA